ncbi:hypothetical protein JCM11251_000085 [Rhodosporidiobolus azoricus]
MGQFFDQVPDNCIDWIGEQKMFWVASAPLTGDGTVNVSPKGHDCFHLVSPREAWYLDISGSGQETISHMYEPGNGRLTIMFNAFTGPPRILRLFGKGKVFERDSPEFDALLPPGDERRLPGARAIIWLDIERVGTSCGFSVPFYEYVEDRPTLLNFYRQKETADTAYFASLPSPTNKTVAPSDAAPKGMAAYWKLKNAESVDGLPGLKAAGWPPEEGAIRKKKGIAKDTVLREGRHVATAVNSGPASGAEEWLRWARERDWTFEKGVAAGMALSYWLVGGGIERLKETVGL